MKHPNRGGRGKHFTKARVRIYKYDGLSYKIRYRKVTSLAA